MRHSIAELNRVSREEFVRLVGPVFEHSPWIATVAADKRPFADLEELHGGLCEVVRAVPEATQLELIQAHPDLGKRAGLTAESTREQTSAGLDNLTAGQGLTIQSQNQAYRGKFGFPFVICARLNNKDSILDALTRRLANTRGEEIKTALEEIFKIARLRLRDLCQPD